MKPITTLIIVMFSSFLGFSQSFSIQNVGTKYSEELINTAFSSANLCGLILESKRNDIVFEDGSIVSILGANEIVAPAECIIQESQLRTDVTWSISANGILIKNIALKPTK